VEGKMDSLKYQEILERKLKLGRHWTFQQENDPKLTSNSRLSEEVLEDSTVASQSPDFH